MAQYIAHETRGSGIGTRTLLPPHGWLIQDEIIFEAPSTVGEIFIYDKKKESEDPLKLTEIFFYKLDFQRL